MIDRSRLLTMSYQYGNARLREIGGLIVLYIVDS